MADTNIIRNNASADLPRRAQVPQSSHSFVPVDSLTNSPRSSTGSTSVLDWNSTSDGEVLEWPFSAPPTPPTLTAPASPPVSSTSNSVSAPVESNGDQLVPSRSSIDVPEPENGPEPGTSAQADLSRNLSEQFRLFNLIVDDMHNTTLSDTISPSRANPPQFPLFNLIKSLSSPTGATPSQDVTNANNVEHAADDDDDIYGPSNAEGDLHPHSPPLFSNTPVATPDTSLSSTTASTILAPGADSDITSMTTVTPAESPAVASSLFLPPRLNCNSNSVDETNTQDNCYTSFIPFITQHSTPTPSVGQRSYATSEASTESTHRIEYQSVSNRSPSPRRNNFRPTWSNGFGHDSWLGSRESVPSIKSPPPDPGQALRSLVSRSPGLFGTPSSCPTSPVPEISASTTCGLHSTGTAAPGHGFAGYSQSVLSTSSVEIGRRGESQVDIPSWLSAAPHPALPKVEIPKVEIPTAIQDSESVRLQYPYSHPFPNHPVPHRHWEARQRARPPLPAIPAHAQATPQFALRSHSPNSEVDANHYFAEAIPSRWNGRTPASPSPRPRPVSPGSTSVSDSPWPVTQPLSPGLGPSNFVTWQSRTPNPPPASGWGVPLPRTPHQNAFGMVPFPASRPVPPTWGGFGSNTRIPTGGSFLNTGFPYVPPAPPVPNPWGTPAQRRLRFAPLPPTPGSNVNNNASNARSQPQPPTLPLPQAPPPSYNFQPSLQQPQQQQPPTAPFGSRPGYLYSTPAPVIPMPTSQMDLYTPSDRFWFSDGTVIFRVEHTLHKVHRHFFELHSEHFKKLLSTYWFSPTSHLFLPEITKAEFERLLCIFYPTDLTKPDITTVEGWTSILALSYKYVMPQLESLAIQKLHGLTTPVEKIALAKKFDFGKKHHRNWLIPAYVDLCSRDAPLSLEEAEQLDMPTVIMVWNVRHAVKVVMSRGRRGVVVQDELVLRLVKENWGLGQEEEEEEFGEDVMSWNDFQYACR